MVPRFGDRFFRLLLLVLVAFAATLRPAAAATDVTITVTLGSTPVQGAFVAVAGTGTSKVGGVTNASGTVMFTALADGTYTVTASAAGTSVGSATIAPPTDTAKTIAVTSSGSVFSALGAYGSQTGTIVADGQTGVFYLNTSSIPSLYRSADYGGTWSPVTISSDDKANGIDGSTSISQLATSGYPGEVAAIAGNPQRVYFSRDFGVTWNSFPVPAVSGPALASVHLLLWGHPKATGAASMLFYAPAGVAAMYYAVMPQSATDTVPSGMTAMATSYRVSSLDPVTIANGSDAPIVAVALTQGGVVKLYRVSSAPNAATDNVQQLDNNLVAGIVPTTAINSGGSLTSFDLYVIGLGGPATGPMLGSTQIPTTIIVYSNNTDTKFGASITTCTSLAFTSCSAVNGANFFDMADNSTTGSYGGTGNVSLNCAANRQSGTIVSVAPNINSSGSIGNCWVTKGSGLDVRKVNGINNNTAMAFDASYGTSNFVVLSGDGSKGAVKSAKTGASSVEGLNRPYFPVYPAAAAAGTATGSGGVAINGLNSPVVRDIAFNPITPSQLAAVLSFTGGGRVVASNDGGATWFDIYGQGGDSLGWWSGVPCVSGCTTPQWILAGVGAGGDLLGAVQLTSTISSSTGMREIFGSTGTALGLSSTTQNQLVTAVKGISGTNLAVVAAGRYPTTLNTGWAEGSLNLVTLSTPGPTASYSQIGTTFANKAPVALAYCPAGSNSAIADKMFVAVAAGTAGSTGSFGAGGLGIITNASQSNRSFAMNTALIGDFQTVHADCSTGTVWAGRNTVASGGAVGSGSNGLYKSTDGGVSFPVVVATGRAAQILQQVRTLTIDPKSPSHVVVFSTATDIVETKDGGYTWNVLNDSTTASCPSTSTSACGHAFGGQPSAAAMPPPSGGGTTNLVLGGVRASTSVTSDQVVIASGAGLYAATTRAAQTSSLQFAQVFTGSTTAVTAGQRVNLTFQVAGVSWTATADQTWVTITPSSGTGTGSFTVTIGSGAPSAPGTYASTITIQTTGGLVSTQYMTVSLQVLATATSAVPFGSVDTPADNSTGISGSIPVTGWALDDVGVKTLSLCRAAVTGETAVADSRCGGAAEIFIGTAVFVNGARPDVQVLYLTTPSAAQAGWGYLMLTNMLPNQGNGTFTLYLHVQDQEGNWKLLGTRTITLDNAHGTKPFGAIDSPAQGETVNGNAYANFGWVLSRGTTVWATPAKGGTVNVVVDGVTVGQPGGWTSRSDLTGLFPKTQFDGVDQALGVYGLDTTALSNAVHTIAWGVSDTGGNSDGIGSRYFTVQNGGGSLMLDPSNARDLMPSASLVGGTAANVLDLPIRSMAVSVQRGYGGDSFETVFPDANGRLAVKGREITRLEITLGAGLAGTARFAGYSVVGGSTLTLPIGSHLDEQTGAFSWQPGVGFVGRYDLAFVRTENGVSERIPVTIVLEPFSTPQSDPRVVIDAPVYGATVGEPFLVGGWTADLGSTDGTGIDAIHVWAYPLTGVVRDPIFLGMPEYGDVRADVARAHGERFGPSAFNLLVSSLPVGQYDIVVYAHSTMTGTFSGARVVRVTVK